MTDAPIDLDDPDIKFRRSMRGRAFFMSQHVPDNDDKPGPTAPGEAIVFDFKGATLAATFLRAYANKVRVGVRDGAPVLVVEVAASVEAEARRCLPTHVNNIAVVVVPATRGGTR